MNFLLVAEMEITQIKLHHIKFYKEKFNEMYKVVYAQK